jgi:hypothetical protein
MTGFLAGFSAAPFMQESKDRASRGPVSHQEPAGAITPRNVLSLKTPFGILYSAMSYCGIL